MEVGQTATPGQHYSKRWDAPASERDPFYTSENWNDNTSNRKAGSTGTGTRQWSDGIRMPSSSTTPSSCSTLFPAINSDGSIDKVLYQNLVEMIPLVETLMDQQNSKSFPRHASLIYTPTPSKDSLMLKKANEQKEKRGHSQFARGRRGVKDGFFWGGNAENVYINSQDEYLEEIPMLSFPTDHQVDQNAVNKDIIARLQGQVEQLEQKLHEKDNQLLAVENNTQQVELPRLQARVEECQRKIASKEQEVQKVLSQLSKKQDEVSSLQCLLEKAKASLEASNSNAAKVQLELENLQCQMAMFILQMQSISSSLDDDPADCEHGLSSESAAFPEDDVQVAACRVGESDTDVELMRRKYLACLITARKSPTEEAMLLVSEIRAQLQNFLMQPNVIYDPVHHISRVQSENVA